MKASIAASMRWTPNDRDRTWKGGDRRRKLSRVKPPICRDEGGADDGVPAARDRDEQALGRIGHGGEGPEVLPVDPNRQTAALVVVRVAYQERTVAIEVVVHHTRVAERLAPFCGRAGLAVCSSRDRERYAG